MCLALALPEPVTVQLPVPVTATDWQYNTRHDGRVPVAVPAGASVTASGSTTQPVYTRGCSLSVSAVPVQCSGIGSEWAEYLYSEARPIMPVTVLVEMFTFGHDTAQKPLCQGDLEGPRPAGAVKAQPMASHT